MFTSRLALDMATEGDGNLHRVEGQCWQRFRLVGSLRSGTTPGPFHHLTWQEIIWRGKPALRPGRPDGTTPTGGLESYLALPNPPAGKLPPAIQGATGGACATLVRLHHWRIHRSLPSPKTHQLPGMWYQQLSVIAPASHERGPPTSSR
jgi:hypothetical protein